MKYSIIHKRKLSPYRHKVIILVFYYCLIKKLPYNAFKTAKNSQYLKYRQELREDIRYYELMPCDNAEQYECNTMLLDALNEELLVLEAKKLLQLID